MSQNPVNFEAMHQDRLARREVGQWDSENQCDVLGDTDDGDLHDLGIYQDVHAGQEYQRRGRYGFESKVTFPDPPGTGPPSRHVIA